MTVVGTGPRSLSSATTLDYRQHSNFLSRGVKVLTQERLKEVLDYAPETGVFTRKVSGAVAGGNDGRGYVRLRVDGKKYKAHRLAWFYVYGTWPNGQIDHINRVKSDNMITNLRDVDNSCNKMNNYLARKDNAIGVLGVSRRKCGYVARITSNGETITLGTFKCVSDASDAYLEAKKIYHGGHTK